MITVKFDAKEVEAKLRKIGGKAPTVISRAINRAATTANSAISKEVKKRYLVKSADIKKTITRRKATKQRLEANIKSQGKRIPLSKFKISPNTPKYMPRGKMHKAKVLKSSGLKGVYRAFTAKMQSGHIGLFERKSSNKFPIKELYGPDVPHMIGYDSVIKEIEAKTNETLKKRLKHELDRVIQA